MKSIIHKTETPQELHYRYLTDRRIATLNNEIAAIYNISIPKYILDYSEKKVEIIYDEKVEYEVQRCKNIIAEIIKTDYPELQYINYETPTKKNKG